MLQGCVYGVTILEVDCVLWVLLYLISDIVGYMDAVHCSLHWVFVGGSLRDGGTCWVGVNVHELRCTTPAGLTIVKDNAAL